MRTKLNAFMTEQQDNYLKEKLTLNSSRILLGAVGLTTLYLLVLFFMVLETNACTPPPVYSSGYPWWKPLWRQLPCLSANELGDFLAGAFAPLAFLWLAATVLIQSKELAAQREELGMTRQEMQASVEQMRAQTQIFQEEQDRKRQEIKDAHFVSIYDHLLELGKVIRFFVYLQSDISKPPQVHRKIEEALYPLKPSSDELGFDTLTLSLEYAEQLFEEDVMKRLRAEENLVDWYVPNPERLTLDLRRYRQLLEQLAEASHNISAPLKIKHSEVNIDALIKSCDQDIERIPELPTLKNPESLQDEE